MRTELEQIERELAGGGGDAYRSHLANDAIVIVPGAVMDRDSCAAAIDAAPRWDEWTIADVSVRLLSAESALLSYRWRSRRGDTRYDAVMSSVYALRDGVWKLVLHQQTPDTTPR